MKLIITVLLIGAVAGLAGALCGVGGGIILVPAFVLILGLGQKTAVATSLAVVVVSGLSGTLSNMRVPGLIDWKIMAVAALGAAIAAWFGAELMRELSGPLLKKIFGGLLVIVGLQMLLVKG